MLKCQKCGGTRIKPSSNFCPYCGEISSRFKELLENISADSAEQSFKIILKRIDRIKKKNSAMRFFYAHAAGFSIAKSGRRNRAVLRTILQAAKGIKGAYDRAYALAITAYAFNQAGHRKPAVKIFLKSIHEAREIMNSEIKSSSLQTISTICRYLKIVDTGVFIGILKTSVEIQDYYHRYNAFSDIISEYLQAGGKDEKVFKTALDLLSAVKKPHHKISALTQIALGYARSGQKEKVKDLLEDALKEADSVGNKGYRVFALQEFVSPYANSGMFKAAFKIVDQIKHPKQKDKALYDIASAYIGRRMYQKALKISHQIHDSAHNQYVLRDIASAYAEGDKIAQALSLTAKIKDPFYQDQAFRHIIAAFIKTGKLSQARKIVPRMSDTYYREFARDEIARAGLKANRQKAKQMAKSSSKVSK